MSKFYGYDEAMENDIAKITTPKLALMSDVVASDKKFIRMENGSLTVIAGVLIAVGNSVFKTEKTTLTASNLDGTATKFEVGKDYCIYICDPTSIATLMIRHNTLRGYEIIQEGFETICMNRLLLVGLSIMFVILSVCVLGQKRKGRINATNIYGKCFGYIQNKFWVKPAK